MTQKAFTLDIPNPVVEVENLDFYYGTSKALHDISLNFPRKQVTALIGPSGCGKSTLLRCFNRMNDLVDGTRVNGHVRLNGEDIYTPKTDVIELRRKVGMVFQKSNPFPKSIYENVIYGLRIAGLNNKQILDETVERSLRGGPVAAQPVSHRRSQTIADSVAPHAATSDNALDAAARVTRACHGS